jgi:KTSC domain
MTAAPPRANKLKWCKDTRELGVTLASGKVYRYANVPLQAFNNFRDA